MGQLYAVLWLMPSRLKRFHHSGRTHFITFCCYRRRKLFLSDASKETFELALERVRRNFQLCVYGYVVKPEHVHLLLFRAGPGNTRGGDSIAQTGSVAPSDRRGRTLLAEAILRLQHPEQPPVHREAPVRSPQPGQQRIVRSSRGLEMEQLSSLR